MTSSLINESCDDLDEYMEDVNEAEIQIELNEPRKKGSESFECAQCMKLFSTKKALKLHISSLHNDLGISCLVCKKSFPNLVSYKHHRSQCDFGVSCLFCRKSFGRLTTFKIHQKMWQRSKRFHNT